MGLHVIFKLRADRAARLNNIVDAVRNLSFARPANAPAKLVLVTRSVSPKAIASWCRKLEVDYIQLQNTRFKRSAAARLRLELEGASARRIGLIRTIVVKGRKGFQACRDWANMVDAVLFDSGDRGGTGREANWWLVRKARSIVAHVPAFIAGGIGPDNARRAIDITRADAVDIQSHSEVPKRSVRDGRVKRRKRKHVGEVLKLCANVRGETLLEARRLYNLRRADVRILMAVTDLERKVASLALKACENLPIDGVQIDASDGTFVPEWPKCPVQWARTAWARAPEIPIWLHIFSTNWDYVRFVVSSVNEVNPHLVGIILQCPPSYRAGLWVSEIAQEGATLSSLVCCPSFTASNVLRAERGDLEFCLRVLSQHSMRMLVVTTPDSRDHGIHERATRTATAIRRFRYAPSPVAEDFQIGVDRGVSVSLLAAMKGDRPDFVIAGRGLLKGRVQSSIAHYLRALRGGSDLHDRGRNGTP